MQRPHAACALRTKCPESQRQSFAMAGEGCTVAIRRLPRFTPDAEHSVYRQARWPRRLEAARADVTRAPKEHSASSIRAEREATRSRTLSKSDISSGPVSRSSLSRSDTPSCVRSTVLLGAGPTVRTGKTGLLARRQSLDRLRVAEYCCAEADSRLASVESTVLGTGTSYGNLGK